MVRRVSVSAVVVSVASVVVLLLCATARVSAAVYPDAHPSGGARVVGVFEMTGRITAAVRVRGERAGETITRRWLFLARSCSARSCRRLSLRRQRSDHRYSTITLHRTAGGVYKGSSRFYAGLRCLGKAYARGEVVPYRLTMRVTREVTVQGISFAQALTARYVNLRRIDRTPCPVGPSHDAATYTGRASVIPTAPTAGFAATVDPATDDAALRSTSVRGAGDAAIASQQWNFGDPASGSADSSSLANPTHQFTGPGVYEVSLSVVDANGLRSAVTEAVTAPAPPTPAVTATERRAPPRLNRPR